MNEWIILVEPFQSIGDTKINIQSGGKVFQ